MDDEENPQSLQGIKRPRTESEDVEEPTAAGPAAAAVEPPQAQSEPIRRGGEGTRRSGQGMVNSIRAYR